MSSKNEKDELILTPENKTIIRKIKFYLQSRYIEEDYLEDTMSDFIGMALESQSRGEAFSDTVGIDYEDFCKEIVENAPRQNFSIKIFNMIISSGICLGLVLPIMYLLALFFGITNIQSNSVYLTAPLAFILKYMLIVFILHTGWLVVKRNIYRSSTVNIGAYIILFIRSEERRVGKECRIEFRSRWWLYE